MDAENPRRLLQSQIPKAAIMERLREPRMRTILSKMNCIGDSVFSGDRHGWGQLTMGGRDAYSLIFRREAGQKLECDMSMLCPGAQFM
jgi:hypothetical protein